VPDLLTAFTAAGGNSHASRSARAKLQWRDRFGRFIEMGRGIKFKFRRPDGSVVSAKGKFVGVTDDPNKGQVYVKGDANGLKDGFYDITSSNAQEILGSLDPAYLQEKGIQIGQHADGTPVSDRIDEEIPNQADIPYYTAPTGWKSDFGGAYVTEDNEFAARPTSFPVKQKTGNIFTLFRNGKSVGSFKDWAPMLTRVNEFDASGPAFDNNAARADARQADADVNAAQADKVARIAPGAGDAKTRASEAIKDYDTDGKIAGLVESGASSKDILDALSLNPTWKAKYENYETRGGVELPTAQQKADWDATEAEVKAIQSLDSEQSISDVDTATGHNLDLSIGDVSADGYLVPTNNNLEVVPAAEFTAEKMADYVNRKKTELTGGGKRLSVTTDDEGNVTFDIVDQVAEHNEAQQLASERASTEIFDVAAGKTITTSQGRPREDGENANPDPSAEQPVGTGDLPTGDVADPSGGGNQVEAPGQEPATGAEPAGGGTDLGGDPNADTSPSNNISPEPADTSNDSSASPDNNAPSSAGDGAQGVELPPVPEAPAPVVDAADNLPSDRDGLTRMAMRLEARAAARQDGPAADVIAAQLDAVYAKIDRLDAGEPATPERNADEKAADVPAGTLAPRTEAPASPGVQNTEAQPNPLRDRAEAARARLRIEEPAPEATPEPAPTPVDPTPTPAPAEPVAPTEPAFAAGDKVRWNETFGQKRERTGTITGPAKREGYWAVNLDNAGRAEADRVAVDGARLSKVDAPETPAPTEPAPIDAPEANNAPEPVQDPIAAQIADMQRQLDEAKARVAELEAERNATPAEQETPAEAPEPAPEVDAPVEAEIPAEALPEPDSTDPASMDYIPADQPDPADVAPAVDVFNNDDDSETEFVSPSGKAYGSVVLSSDGNYVARSLSGDGAFSRFASRDAANNWMGERIAQAENSNVNPIGGARLGDGPAPTDNPVYAGSLAVDATPSRVGVLRNLLEGKDISPAEKQDFLARIGQNDLVQGEAADLRAELSALPDAPVSRSKPRDPETNPANFTQSNAELENLDPNQIADPNLIMQDVKRNHDGYRMLANGDVIVESRNVGNKTYDLIVRRTANEKFFPYIRETDTSTGVSRAFKVGDGTHSCKALRTKLNTGKAFLRANDVDKRFKAKRKGVEVLPEGGAFNEVPDPIRDFIEHTDLSRSGDEHTDKMAAVLSNLIVRGEERKVLDEIAKREDLSPEFVDRIVASVNRKTINDRLRSKAERDAVIKKSHIPYGGGDALVAGDWVDWTDYRPNINVGKPNEEPNPNYGRVYRGQVRQLRYKTNDGNGAYVYSDSTYVVFEGMNEEAGINLGRQRQRIASQLKKVDNEFSPASAPFFAKKDEKAKPSENIVRTFNVPDAPLRGETLPIEKPERAIPVPEDVKVDIDGNQYVGDDENPIAIPDNGLAMLFEIMDRESFNVQYSDIVPGDYIVTHHDGAPRNALVTKVAQDDGQVAMDIAYYDTNNVLQKTTVTASGSALTSVDRVPDMSNEQTVVPEGVEAENPVAQARVREIGERVFVDDIPGRYGVVSNVSEPNTQGERTYTVVGDQTGLEYPRQERYLQDDPTESQMANATIRPASQEPDQGWKRELATPKQVNFLRSLAAKKKLTPASQKQINKALADPELSKGQASQFIDELKNYQDKPAPRATKPEAVEAVLQGVADQLKRDPDAAVSGQDVQDAINAAQQDRAAAEAAEVDRKYGGYDVKAIEYSDVVYTGADAPFIPRYKLFSDMIRVGDIIPMGVGKNMRMEQVVEILPESGRFKVRVIANPAGDYNEYDGQLQNQYISPYIPLAVVYTPSGKMSSDYFRPAPTRVRAPGAPEDLNSYTSRADDILDRVGAGYKKVKKIAAGAINQGAWYIQPKDGGDELFMKQVSAIDGNREFHNEIVVSKLFNAFGLTDVVVTGLDDKRTIIQTKVSGDMAGKKMDDAEDIKANPELYPNARLIGLVDYLVVNSDRHAGNWFVNDEGQPVPIDHGYTWFDEDNYVMSPFVARALGRLQYGGGRGGEPAFTLAELRGYRNLVSAMRGDFTGNGNVHGEKWYQFVLSRLDTLINNY
jgi:hypothetical protein